MTIEEENKQLRQKVVSLERELRLMKLRRQTTPHFLFNSISVAIGLVMQSPRTGIRFLRLVAKMYRYLLEHGEENTASIEQELMMMQNYFDLMSMRYVGTLHLTITDRASQLHGYLLPPLTLQGLVENAIKHNAHTTDEPLAITVDTDGTLLTVSNPIMPVYSGSQSTHLGLKYMNESMQLLFGREINISNDGSTFKVDVPLISLPLTPSQGGGTWRNYSGR